MEYAKNICYRYDYMFLMYMDTNYVHSNQKCNNASNNTNIQII